MQAHIYLDSHFHIGDIDPRLFSGFIEHLGRAIYDGIYDPTNPLSDERGFRRDVIAALKPLGMPLMRYPGGNFVSAYDWRDGIGPQAERPVRPDYAWHTIEPNTFGVDEFMAWCQAADIAPMMAVNLGTLGAKEAAALLEYCNLSGTAWSEQRRANGHAAPYDVKTWCLGNEMDGYWQAGHVPAIEYAYRAAQAGRLMKALDPGIELVCCGSTARSLHTYLNWDREVLEYCWDIVDYVSAHNYSHNRKDDSAWFLAEGVEIESILEDYIGVLQFVRGVKKSNKRVYVSFDEWNVWYRETTPNKTWAQAPAILEEHYNLEDALVAAQYLLAFLRHADVVKIACLAQVVNVIAPILTREDGVLLQSIYYPFALISKYARGGKSLVPAITAPTYQAGGRGETPVLDAAASYDAEGGRLGVFMVNRSLTDSLTCTVETADLRIARIAGMDVLTGDDPKAANTWETPSHITPHPGRAMMDEQGNLRAELPPCSFAALRAEVKGR